MIFFLVINLLQFRLHTFGRDTSLKNSSPRVIANAFEFTALVLAFTYLQILFGAFMRHSGSGAACGLGSSAALMCIDSINNVKTFWPASVTSQVHMLHRWGALFLGIVSIAFALWSILNSSKLDNDLKLKFKSFSWKLITIVLLQIGLGIATVVDYIGPVPTTLHLAGAALMLVVLWRHFLLLKIEMESYSTLSNSFLRDLFEMSKPKLTLLVVVTTFTGILLTPDELHPIQVLLILISMFVVVSGAAILNCYMERHVDAKMERTKSRPLPNNRFSPYLALIVGIFLNVFGMVMLYWQSNLLTAILALIASGLYLLAYTPLKQNSAMALFVGALPGAMPSLIGWTALTNDLGVIPISLVLIMILWQIPHFMAIATRYKDEYQNAGLIVFPNQLGIRPSIIIAVLTSALLLAVSLGPYLLGGFSLVYAYAALLLGAVFLMFNIVWMTQRSNTAIQLGARNVFWASIAYLPLLLACMIFFK
jgi:protoheme IX farnesyltransferase